MASGQRSSKTRSATTGSSPNNWDWAAGARVAAFQMNRAKAETDDAALIFTEELIFPECGKRVAAGDVRRGGVDFQADAETETDFVERQARKPFGDGAEG